MSSRQIERLRRLHGRPAAKETPADEEEQDFPNDTNKQSRFLELDELSDDTIEDKSDSNEESSTEIMPQKLKQGPIKKNKKKNKKSNTNEKMTMLNDLMDNVYISTDSYIDLSSLLEIDGSFLSGEKEKYKLYGKEVASSNDNNHQKKKYFKYKPKARSLTRKFLLLAPDKNSTPPPTYISGGWSMKKLETTSPHSCISDYECIFSDIYLKERLELENIISMFDINLLQSYLMKHQYSIEGLLQMYNYLLFTKQIEQSQEIMKRLLYIIECNSHPLFMFNNPNQRLDYSNVNNQFLYNILFNYNQSLFRRGYFRSSLELTKFLYSLDPFSDPLGLLCLFDFLALSSGRHIWLQNFINSKDISFRGITLIDYPMSPYTLALISFISKNHDQCWNDLLKAMNNNITYFYILISLLPNLTQNLAKIKLNIKNDRYTKLMTIHINRNINFWKSNDIQDILSEVYQVWADEHEGVDENPSVNDDEYMLYNEINPDDFNDKIPDINVDWLREGIRHNHDEHTFVEDSDSFLQLFLNSILPWNNLNTTQSDDEDDADDFGRDFVDHDDNINQ